MTFLIAFLVLAGIALYSSIVIILITKIYDELVFVDNSIPTVTFMLALASFLIVSFYEFGIYKLKYSFLYYPSFALLFFLVFGYAFVAIWSNYEIKKWEKEEGKIVKKHEGNKKRLEEI